MPSLNELRYEYDNQPDKGSWFAGRCSQYLKDISERLGDTNVLCYFSAFFEKPESPTTSLSYEDIKGFMDAFSNMDFNKDLVLILHTPGGDLAAVEMIIEYIHSKFRHVIAIIPVMSASAGSMIALSCDKIIVSRVGQLGPTDPQIPWEDTFYSAKELISQFEMARDDTEQNPAMAHFWAPILSSYSPSLYLEALNANEHSIKKLRQWLSQKIKDASTRRKIINSFHKKPKVHDARISYQDMKKLGLNVSLLEDDQKLQDAVLNVYHVLTIVASTTPMFKLILNHKMRGWIRTDDRL